jgi:hypothetical protein
MEARTKDLAVSALGKLAQAICGGKHFTDKEYNKIAEVLDALSEKPESLSIDRSKLEVVWPESERYLGANSGGRLVVLLSQAHKGKKNFVKKHLEAFGVNKDRICILIVTDKNVEKMLDSTNCCAVLCDKGVSNDFKEMLYDENSAIIQGVSKDMLKRALAELAKKLK